MGMASLNVFFFSTLLTSGGAEVLVKLFFVRMFGLFYYTTFCMGIV